ncbi:MAG: hypothetical protein GC191_10535 [Azospirillum sp.]|nr:hypothetical protein [Azospirillum sp.]
MKVRGKITLAGMSVLLSLSPNLAEANFMLNKIINKTSETISVASLVPGGNSVVIGDLGTSKFQIGIAIPTYGVIFIGESDKICPGYSWAAKIEFDNGRWGFGYEGTGLINITINEDGTIDVGGSETSGGSGKVFPGGC